MASYVIDINSTDDLDRVIKKCNTNFKALASQKQQQDIVNMRDLEDVAAGLDMEIQNVDSKFADYTKTSDLAAVALSGDYGDLGNAPTLASVATSGSYDDLTDKPEFPVGGAYVTFGNEDPADEFGGTWSLAGTVQVGSDSLKVWKKTV